MSRTVEIEINGVERTLHYSVEVMFEMTEKYKSISEALKLMAGDGEKAFETLRWFAVKMANDGELLRREEGHEKKPLLSEKELTLRIQPLEYGELKDAVVRAITLGYRRDMEEEDKEIDLGLQELNEKKTKAGN